jgi:hypothetical protein
MSVRSLVLGLVLSGSIAVAQVGPAKGTQPARYPVFLERARVGQSESSLPPLAASSADTVKILAIMVDFQTSTGGVTTGTGKFQLDPTSAIMIDPPPHDSAYFAYKLQFLSNYFRKVSNSRVIIRGEVLGRVITLPKQMSSYSPAKDGSNDKPLANLVVESWRAADSLYPSIQFDKYQAFVLFHAGVGRDLDIVGLLGYDPAPFDIPSLTFNLSSLRKYLGDPSYAGVPVDGGTYRITNTLILPETETRLIPVTGGSDTLQGSINGLLANSFGSFLGLPDLFNTRTARSGIGIFGLMDVAGSINFYGGLFPPEPSAWEKIYLGWVTPITVAPGTSTLTIPAVGLKTGRDTVYKIPITDKEYFLVENRSRDPYRNGQTVTVRRGQSVTTLSFPTDTAGFTYDDIGAINGSVIDIEDFDWALPGLTSYGDTFAGGGILIWHIDESVIARGLASNTVNADIDHPGVYLEEADGSRDIGRTYDPFSEPGAGSELGSPLDFWFDGNSVLYVSGTDTLNFYKNVFDKDSHPDSRSHSGASSLVTIRQFSRKAARMTAIVEIGDSQLRRIGGFTKNFGVASASAPLSATPGTVLAGVGGKIYARDPQGKSRTKDSTGLLALKGGAFAPCAIEFDKGLLIAGVQDSTLTLINATDELSNGVFESVAITDVRVGDRISTPAMYADLAITPSFVIGTAHGTVARYAPTGTLQSKTTVSGSPVTSLMQLPTASLSKPAELFFACGGRLYSEQSSVSLGDSALPWMLAGAVNRSGDFIVAAQRGGRRIAAYSRDLSRKLFDIMLAADTLRSLSVADINADGEKDVIAVMKTRLYVINTTGTVLSGFPVAAPAGGSYVGDALVSELGGSAAPEILIALSTGDLMAFTSEGNTAVGFPVQFTPGGDASMALFKSSGGSIGVASITSKGQLQAAEILRPYNDIWTQAMRNSRHWNSDGSGGGSSTVSGEFLPKAKTYNWPNPVYGSSTNIRYYTSEDAAVTVTVFDLAGLKIAELKARAKGGLDGELTWDVSNIQSGVYLAKVEAVGNSRTEVVVIKIAVVK